MATPAARTRIFFSGAASQVESAFHTELHRYMVNDEPSLANATEVYIPQAISGMVLGVRGFENFRPRPRARVAVKPNFTSHQTGNHFIAPADFATIYNIPAALDGTGQTIAVVGQTRHQCQRYRRVPDRRRICRPGLQPTL